jgi:hypothetical protein
VRHLMGMASIKTYDKFGQILRIETTAKDISFFKHYREVEQRMHKDAWSYRGFNFFDQDDEALFLALTRGEFTISGVQNKAPRALFTQYSSGQMSRILRLRKHGLTKGQSLLQVLSDRPGQTGCHPEPQTQGLVIIPELAAVPAR